jgi:hypothetical protein
VRRHSLVMDSIRISSAWDRGFHAESGSLRWLWPSQLAYLVPPSSDVAAVRPLNQHNTVGDREDGPKIRVVAKWRVTPTSVARSALIVTQSGLESRTRT